MNRRPQYVIAGILICGLLIWSAVHFLSPSVPIPEAVYPHNKTIRYGFAVTNKSGESIRTADFLVFAPIAQTASQKVDQILTNRTYQLVTDHLGNQQLKFVLENIAPYSTKMIDITVKLKLADEPNPIGTKNSSNYLSSEPYIETDSKIVQTISKTFNDSTDKPRDIHNWLVKNVRYAGYISEDRGAEYALKQRKGDCTEYMYGFIALSRTHQIPSRGVGGFVVDQQNSLLRSTDYHNWAEYHEGNNWYIADPQRQIFRKLDRHYIAFRYISREEGRPMENSQRFLAFDPRLTVKMI